MIIEAQHRDDIAVMLAHQQDAILADQARREEAIAADQARQLDAVEASRAGQLNAIAFWQERTVRAIKEDMVYQLELIQFELQKLFTVQYAALTGTVLPPPTPPAPPVAAQLGGFLMAYASLNRAMTGPLTLAGGGMVPAMLEPGERVMAPPFSRAQQLALAGVNAAYPRFQSGGFTVPGRGTGDTVPMWVPAGSFVLNRHAAGAMGYQGGGMVTGGARAGGSSVSIHLDLRGSQFSKNVTLEELRALLRELERRGLQRRGPHG